MQFLFNSSKIKPYLEKRYKIENIKETKLAFIFLNI